MTDHQESLLANLPEEFDPYECMPTMADFANAVCLWTSTQPRDRVTVGEVAASFHAEPDLVRRAVERHAWMFLLAATEDGTEVIELEGM